MGNKRSGLLTFVSVLYIIGGAFAIILAIMGGVGGTMVAFSGFAAAGVALIVVILLSCIGGIFQFIAGVMGATQKNIGGCQVMGVIILIFQIISLIVYIVCDSFSWFYLITFVLTILYLCGVSIAKSLRS